MFIEINDGEVLDVAQALHCIDQAAVRVARQIDLRHIAGDYDLRAVPHAGEEHFHLRDRRVLPFVEDDDRLIQRSAPHVRQRRDLSMMSLSMYRFTWSGSIMSFRPSKSSRRYGLILATTSPGRKPSFSPASTAGRTRTIRLTAP